MITYFNVFNSVSKYVYVKKLLKDAWVLPTPKPAPDVFSSRFFFQQNVFLDIYKIAEETKVMLEMFSNIHNERFDKQCT